MEKIKPLIVILSNDINRTAGGEIVMRQGGSSRNVYHQKKQARLTSDHNASQMCTQHPAAVTF